MVQIFSLEGPNIQHLEGDAREQVKMSERANEHILKYRLKGFRI